MRRNVFLELYNGGMEVGIVIENGLYEMYAFDVFVANESGFLRFFFGCSK